MGKIKIKRVPISRLEFDGDKIAAQPVKWMTEKELRKIYGR